MPVESTSRQRISLPRVILAIQPRLEFIDINPRRLGLAEEDDVVADALVVVAPDDAVGEDLEEGSHGAFFTVAASVS